MSHQTISFIKSGFRILGYFSLLVNTVAAVVILIGSEYIGIVEEVGEK